MFYILQALNKHHLKILTEEFKNLQKKQMTMEKYWRNRNKHHHRRHHQLKNTIQFLNETKNHIFSSISKSETCPSVLFVTIMVWPSLVLIAENFYYVNYGLSIIMSNNFSDENINTGVFIETLQKTLVHFEEWRTVEVEL